MTLRLKIALAFLFTAAILSTGCTDPASKLPNYDKVPAFSMTDSTGHSFRGEDLAGKVWIADFIYTTCPLACPRMTAQMHKLEKEVRGMQDVELVSFSVDPQHDSPPVLNDFASRFGGPTAHWVFLTGTPASVHLIADKTFHVGNEIGKIEHSTKFILVDKSGDIRGYYSSSDSGRSFEAPERRGSIAERAVLMPVAFLGIHDLPLVDATLNGLAAILLVTGHFFIGQYNIRRHRQMMISAFVVSCVFLVCYLVYHYNVGEVRFDKPGWVRTVYLPILATHVALAATVPFLATITLVLALRGKFQKHRALAKWTFPIWLYVSVTGVIVYLLLYQVKPRL